MREIPDCLNRRYRALDELIRELSSLSNLDSAEDYTSEPANDAGIKLMCDFWNILKEDPDCNLTQAVRQRMGLSAKSSRQFRPQQVTCYMACNNNSDESRKKHACGKIPEQKSPEQKSPEQKSPASRATCCSSKSFSPRSTTEVLPLSKVLCNLKDAVSFDKKCNVRIGELILAEKQLQDQIQHLEHREKEGIQMLKQADCMWSCMEEAYKTKVAESIERQGVLLKQMKEVETSNTKWRKNKKDLEFQLNNINKCYAEITEKINEKKNDVHCIKMEVENFKKRIQSNKQNTAAVKKSFDTKKKASDATTASLAAEMTKLKQLVAAETEYKQEKEYEGSLYIKEAREELKKICKVLLKKKLENEDIKSEKEALMQEIQILKKTCDQCKEKCHSKKQDVINEIAKVDNEISGYKVRCIRCHECTDTADVRKFCTDCPRCAEERDCIYEDGQCQLDTAMDCVCINIKQKFLDNVFDNMYTVLERQAKTSPGKAVADQVLNCLKRSRNGKLNEDTRKILQDFVLTTVKKNLNLTIIGGAVKTRCEMDPETYKQLMLCLKHVKTVKAPKVDKGTAAKKDPCRRWGGASECNCPKGPKACICSKKAPLPPNDPGPCPPPDKEDASVVVACPHKESTSCGPDCAMHAVPSAVGTDIAAWRPAPCDEKNCQFSKNMRAAQCVLGPDSLTSVSKSKGYVAAAPLIPDIHEHEEQIACKCEPEVKPAAKPCICRKEQKTNPRDRIIEEVMGRYTDVMPIEKVTNVDEGKSADTNKGKHHHRCSCANFPIKKILRKRTSENKITPLCACTSFYSLAESHKRHCKRLCQNKRICRRSKDYCDSNKNVFFKILPDSHCKCSERCVFGVKNNFKIAAVTCPKHGTFTLIDKSAGSCHIKESYQKCIADVSKNTSEGVHMSEEDSTKEKSVQNTGVTLFGRIVCDTVKNLIKNLIVPDTTKTTNSSFSLDVEWITVESFLKEISCLTRSKDTSNTTINEVEIANELLSDTNIKLNTKDSLINMFILSQSGIDAENFKASMKDKLKQVICYLFVNKSYGDSPLISNTTSKESSVTFSNNLEHHSHDEKHLKVEVEQCNQGPCTLICEQAIDERNIEKKETVIKKESLQNRNSKVPDSQNKKDVYFQDKTKIKEVCSIKKENKSNIMKKRPSKETLTKRSGIENKNVTFSGELEAQKKKSLFENQFKIKEEKESSLANRLTKVSCYLEMELDESIIKQIEQKMVENNNISISLLRTESGHLQVDLSSSNESSSNKQKVMVKQSPSGSLFFEINKSTINILKPDIIMDEKKLELDNNPFILVSIKPRKQKKKITDSQNAEKVDAKHACRIKSDTKPDYTRNNDTKEMKLIVDRRNSKDIIIRIKDINGTYIPTKANLLIAEAGNIAFIINNISSFGLLGEIIDQCKEHSILLTETDSGSYILDCQSEKSNAIIRKTRSGKVMIVKVDPVVKFMETNENLSTQISNNVFKISVKNPQEKVAMTKVVLQSTPSNNYIVVIDKEYETRYKETVKSHLDSNYECPVELVSTSSGNYLINFEESDDKLNVNAKLVRSGSGNIKIITTTPEMNRFLVDSNTKSVCSKVKSSLKVIDNLLNTLPGPSKDKSTKQKPQLLETKSSSDSKLYEKVKIKLHNRQNLLSEPSALLKKTTSGQYSVVLNKESKKSFINNLKSYLASNSQGLIPIKRTESGEITIILNTDDKSKGQYGSLKITPSGNIYVLVNEKVIKSMAKSCKHKDPTTMLETSNAQQEIGFPQNPVNKKINTTKEKLTKSMAKSCKHKDPTSMLKSSKAQQEIGFPQNPLNKKITTTCNAFPDNSSCDASKCVCAELLKHGVDISNSDDKDPKCCFKFCEQKDEDLIRNELKCNYKNCDCGMCPENCVTLIDEQRQKSPHIVIKPCCCKPELQKKVNSKPMFFVTEEVCLFHKNRYDSVSNELLEISGMCNKNDEKESKLVYDEKICINQAVNYYDVPSFRESNLDYLDFLPPQLPYFLRDFRCA